MLLFKEKNLSKPWLTFLKQLLLSVCYRLSVKSSNNSVFNQTKAAYGKGLKYSGYNNRRLVLIKIIEKKYIPKKWKYNLV